MINFYFADFAKLVLALFLAISHSAGKPAAEHASLLSLGDNINGMTLSKGADDAHSLWAFWAFCFNSPEGEGSYILDCRVPALASPRIGNLLLYANEAIPMDWSDLVWELSIDGQAVDLEPFETFDYVAPSMSKILSSPVLETFKRGTGWNIVLTDLKPGHHTLWLVAESKMGSYTWFVNLDIEPVGETNISSIPFSLHS
jgi:hypothetical protein